MSIVSHQTVRRGVVALSGNPRPRSRTLLVATRLAEGITDLLHDARHPINTLDLAEIAGQLFDDEAPNADRYRRIVAASSVAVIATPVHKASYTGLLKAFVDRSPGGALRGVIAVPVVVSASPAHSFVGEFLLRPLLVELGATVAVPSFTITEAELADLGDVISVWLAANGDVLTGLVRQEDTVGAR